jgi:hypothetical protein
MAPLEGALTTDTDQRRRYIYQFDVTAKRYADRRWQYRMNAPGTAIGELTTLDPSRLLVIERDNDQGPAARTKKVMWLISASSARMRSWSKPRWSTCC